RSETDRTSTDVDGLRSYYLATGAIHRAAMELRWSIDMPDRRKLPPGVTFFDYEFPSGHARVEFIPEAARLDVNFVPVQDLFRLATALGVEPERAQEIAAAIDDWRR